MNVLIFDFWADYAHFRKFYTTTSPLTFSFPPPSAIAGILGAICGVNKQNNEYLDTFSLDKCKIAVQILNPVNKIRMGINLLETKKNFNPKSLQKKPPASILRTQIRTEFLKGPRFRIYFAANNTELFQRVEEFVIQHKSIYTPSMGLSELLADFKYVITCEAVERTDNNPAEISTVICASSLLQSKDLQIETGKTYFKERMPIKMNTARVIERYDDVIYEPDGKTISAKIKTYYKLDNGAGEET
ncbi:CRISPR-associated protein Cas5, subtype I-B/HMARI, partial [Candidatus Magnetoovum chiemensis]